MRHSLTRLFPLVIAAALVGTHLDCTSFPTLTPGTCGDGVIDANEDCDGNVTQLCEEFEAGVDAAPNPGQTGCGLTCGAPGAGTQQCRLLCMNADDSQCPRGWGCGVDDICRRPSAGFTSGGPAIPSGAWRVELGDFDGDGVADALTRTKPDIRSFSEVRLNYLDTQFSVTKTLAPTPHFASPEVIDMNADGLMDLVAEFGEASYSDSTTNVGIAVLLGQPGQSLAAVAYPFIDVPIDVRYFGVPFDGLTNSKTCAFGSMNGAGILLQAGPDIPVPIPIAPLPATIDLLAGKVVVARMFHGANYPCSQILFPFTSPNGVAVVSPCMPGPPPSTWTTAPEIVTVTVPAGWTVQGTPLATDMNGDGILDLLVPAMKVRGATFVAYGNDAGAFSDPLTGTPNLAGMMLKYEPKGGGSVAASQVLATGDLNRDCHPDFVTTDTFIVSTGSVDPTTGAALYDDSRTGVWTEAVVADFNRDGQPDVFAINGTDTGLQFLETNMIPAQGGIGPDASAPPASCPGVGGATTLYPFSLSTTGSPFLLVAGDFDGDLTTDLAFAQNDSSGDGSDDFEIAYGVPLGFPMAPITIGRLGKAEELVGMPPSSDLIAVSSSTSGVTSFITEFLSNGDRPPQSAYELNVASSMTSSPTISGTPLSFVAAPLTGAPSYPDIAAIAFPASADKLAGAKPPYTVNYWLIRENGSAMNATAGSLVSPPAESPAIGTTPPFQPVRFSADAFAGIPLLMTAGDVNGDGVQRVIAVAPAAMPGTSTLLVSTYDAKSALIDVGTVITPLPFGVADVGKVLLSDADGDGDLDVLILSGPTADTGSATDGGASGGGIRNLWVVWNENGTFSPNPTPIIGGPTSADSPQDFDVININAGSPKAIVYVTTTQVMVAVACPGQQFAVAPMANAKAAIGCVADGGSGASGGGGLPTLTNGTGIAATDIDGDGVDDLAIVDAENLLLFKGAAVLP